MTKDDLPPPTVPSKPLGMTGLPLDDDWATYYTTNGRTPPRGFSPALWDEAAVRAAIAAHDAKREKVLLVRERNGDPFGGTWELVHGVKSLPHSDNPDPNYTYAWAYIEREGV